MAVNPENDALPPSALAAEEPKAARKDPPPRPFRLDASDVAFLRSIGIDGTRRASRNRRG